MIEITQAMLDGTVNPDTDTADWLWSHAFHYALPIGTEDAEAYATWYVGHCDPEDPETWTSHGNEHYGLPAWRKVTGR
jgi:hypothetical protein